ncbi:MAG: hypothetical protein ACRETH_05060, partial [Steroidobacteraceae bacterium]
MDLTRYRMAAALMVNWMCRVLGSMMLRPGGAYIGATAANAQARVISFVFGATDTARIEVTAGNIQVWVADALVSRIAVATVVTNGGFVGSLAGWTDSSDPGAAVTWNSNGNVSFVGTGTNTAILDQQVSLGAGAAGLRHALRIIVLRGPLTFRCGSAQGDDSYISETTLNTGTHSLALTPASYFWLRFENENPNASILGSCNVEGAGVMSLPAPWLTADVPFIRWAQSADVVYVGANGYPQQQIERRAVDSWSIVAYPFVKGPFRPINVTNTTLAASAISGDITLTASKPLFKASQVGALFRMISIGQLASSSLAAANTFTNPVFIQGIGAQRNFTITITGSWVGTLTLQYSVGSVGTWIDQGSTWTGNTTQVFGDGFDNQAIYYRIGFKTGNYTSGTAVVSLAFAAGSITGVVRITGLTDSKHARAAVISALGGTAATTNWYEGAWSAYRGYPGTPCLWQGRLWWFGTSVFASGSDDYPNFDDTIIGDSAPIIGQLDSGPVENIYWAIGLQQLVLGNASGEVSCRSTYLGDPVTPTNFNTMEGSTQGSANVNGLRMDRSGVFVQVTGSRVFSLDLDIYTYS